MAVALLALFLAVGGNVFAYGLGRNSVHSRDIAPGAVRANDLGKFKFRKSGPIPDRFTHASRPTSKLVGEGDVVGLRPELQVLRRIALLAGDGPLQEGDACVELLRGSEPDEAEADVADEAGDDTSRSSAASAKDRLASAEASTSESRSRLIPTMSASVSVVFAIASASVKGSYPGLEATRQHRP